jgi:hypothetical protein
MATKAADDYAYIARRMKDLGCTRDAPPSEAVALVEPSAASARVDLEAYRRALQLWVERGGVFFHGG